jgi:hypothetical protein
MNTKLTLRLDSNAIAEAKAHAAEQGRSVSSLVEDYFFALAQLRKARTEKPPAEQTPPLTASLWGVLGGAGIDEEDYRQHLEERHR